MLHPILGFALTTACLTKAAWPGIRYRAARNIVYAITEECKLKLDLYLPRDESRLPHPTMVYFHGGGWASGAKELSIFKLRPFLAHGMAVVNVDYRLARISPAPAAVEDCRRALHWAFANAERYDLDPTRLAVSGDSAGGHLALMTGMRDPLPDYDSERRGHRPPKISAIVNFYGITDVADLLDGPNKKEYAIRWLAGSANREELARQISPLSHVGNGLPPILTIHGDADPLVPYQHAVRLHQALNDKQTPNELLTIPGGKHGRFDGKESLLIDETIGKFLKTHGVLR